MYCNPSYSPIAALLSLPTIAFFSFGLPYTISLFLGSRKFLLLMSCLHSHAEGGKQVANPKIIGLIPLSQDPQILMINPQTANPQILTKYCTILFQNSHRSRLFKQFFSWYKSAKFHTCGRVRNLTNDLLNLFADRPPLQSHATPPAQSLDKYAGNMYDFITCGWRQRGELEPLVIFFVASGKRIWR